MQKNLIKPITATSILALTILACSHITVQPEEPTKVTPTPPTSVVTAPTSNFSDALPSLYPFGNQTSFIKGQVSATANTANVSSFMATKIATPDMGSILKSGEKLNMVALGGGMTAGMRNGGLYRYGQMTAYPNLVARQMGMTDFQTPLFAENEANGTGYLQLVDDGSQYPSWKEVSNNKATVKAGSPPELAKYTGGTVHNYALPDGGLIEMGVPVNNLGINLYTNTWSTGRVFSNRLLLPWKDQTESSLRNQMLKQPINFFIVEDDADNLFSAIKNNANSLSSFGYEKSSIGPTMLSYTLNLLKENANTDKGVVFTWPIITDLAYFNWFSIADLKSKAKSISISTQKYGESFVLDGNESNFLLLPSANTDALFRNLRKGDVVSVTIPDEDILDPNEFHRNTYFIRQYNNRIRELAQKGGLAVVDLEKIYAQINNSAYLSNDGFKVTGGGRGNFFSADGIYPTAIGQAVIANEVIKAINTTYKSKIPLINLRDYSQSVGKE
jgi:hypothetical protein